jgi:hypothetical protein
MTGRILRSDVNDKGVLKTNGSKKSLRVYQYTDTVTIHPPNVSPHTVYQYTDTVTIHPPNVSPHTVRFMIFVAYIAFRLYFKVFIIYAAEEKTQKCNKNNNNTS